QADRLKNVPMSKTRAVFAKCQEMRNQGIEVTALTLGEPDFHTPEYIKEACKNALDQNLTKYEDNNGPLELRQAICKKLKDENGLEYTADEISVTTGVAQGMFAAILGFVNPGEEIIVPDPVYLTYSAIPNIAGAVIKNYRLLEENDYQVDLDELESLVTDKTKMIVIVSPSNPTGGVLDKTSLQKIAEVAKKHNLLVLSDEIYERLTYDEDKPAISIASLPEMKERTIVLNGLSKSMAMTGWRIGYMAAPVELIEPLNRLTFYMTAGATTFAAHAAIEAMKNLDGSIEKMRDKFKERRDYLVAEINKMKNFSCKMPEGAFYVFMNIKKTGMTSEAFCQYALEKVHLAVIPGDAFGKCGEGYVRMSYATSMETLEKAVECLEALDTIFGH
ncbi:MAG: pyridoxal phosphate-dependent aminotransferase, partial [Firmicutes bacterium]|nr:pyridoxal phosphate-dependent aminotransferase [Bacillota bacterium]